MVSKRWHDGANDANGRWSSPVYPKQFAHLPWYVRMVKQGLLQCLPALVFLGIPGYSLLRSSASPSGKALSGGLLFLLAVLYLGISHAVEWRFCIRIVYLLALILADICFSLSIGAPRECVYYSFYLAVGIALLLPYDLAIYAMALLLICLIITAANSPVDIFGLGMACGAALVGYSLINNLEQYRRREVKAQEDERNASLAIALERERIGRDLHDILGHSLTAIVVKADLAERLVLKDAHRAMAEIQELRDISRQALADVRSTASGLHQVRLASELASALSVLSAAGIVCVAPSAVPVFDDEISKQLGYVLRECVTNMVRHSAATRCEIKITEQLFQISDNGHGMRGSEGAGMAGIRRRAEQWGELVIDTCPTGTTTTIRKRAT